MNTENTENEKSILGSLDGICFEEADGNAVTYRIYNMCIGISVVAGCTINTVMARYFGSAIMNLHPGLVLAIYLIGSLGGTVLVNMARNAAMSLGGFLLLVVSMGILLTCYASAYTGASIDRAFLITLCITVAATVLASAKPDLVAHLGVNLGSMLLITLAAELLCIFVFHLDQDIFDYIFVALFAGFIAFDWTRAQEYAPTLGNALRAAASIYVDLINVFIYLLRITGSRKQKD